MAKVNTPKTTATTQAKALPVTAKTTANKEAPAKPVTPQLVYLKANLIHPHPLNPRPKSEFYQCNVHDEKVEDLIASIQGNGFDLLEPIQVRAIGTTYQIIAGHHRYCALVALNMKEIPCVILIIDEVDAAIRLVARQGRSIEAWDLARHAYELCKEQEICSQTEYSKKTGYQATLISKWVRAEEVRLSINIKSSLTVTACASIARAPQEKWPEIAAQAIKEKLGTREIDQLVATTQDKIPPDNKNPQLTKIENPPTSPQSEKAIASHSTIELKQEIPDNTREIWYVW